MDLKRIVLMLRLIGSGGIGPGKGRYVLSNQLVCIHRYGQAQAVIAEKA